MTFTSECQLMIELKNALLLVTFNMMMTFGAKSLQNTHCLLRVRLEIEIEYCCTNNSGGESKYLAINQNKLEKSIYGQENKYIVVNLVVL